MYNHYCGDSHCSFALVFESCPGWLIWNDDWKWTREATGNYKPRADPGEEGVSTRW